MMMLVMARRSGGGERKEEVIWRVCYYGQRNDDDDDDDDALLSEEAAVPSCTGRPAHDDGRRSTSLTAVEAVADRQRVRRRARQTTRRPVADDTRLMAADGVGDDVVASLPRLSIVAATELGGKNVAEGRSENGEVAVRNVPLNVLLVQMVELGLQRFGLVEHVDGDVETGEHALGVSDELGRGRVVAANAREQRAGFRCLREDRSPESLSKVLAVGSGAVGATPLRLDLQPRQRVALGGTRHGHARSKNQHNGGLHCDVTLSFLPQGYCEEIGRAHV